MKKTVMIIALAMLVCLMSFALADGTDKFLGKWVCNNVIVDGKTYTMFDVDAELEAAVLSDGTALVHTVFDHISDDLTGVWAAEGDNMIVTDGQVYMLFTMNAAGKLVVKSDSADFILDHLHSVEINEENFPDEYFRWYVGNNAGGADRLLVDYELNYVTELYIYDRGITDLKGIEFFTNLRELDCGNNQLTKLDVSKNTKLTSLSCYGNQLTELDVRKNTKLTELSCSGNQLTQLDVSKCKALKELDCSHNMITKLNVNSNKKLERLACGHNQLTSVNVSKNAKLIQLSTSWNQLTSVDVSKNAALLSLDVTGNKLSEIDVSHNPLLSDLECGSNPLTKLDISKNPELTGLYCEGIGLTKLDVTQHPRLRRLICRDNRLTALNVSANPNLEKLDCANNLLTSLDVSKNTKLTELDCSNNYLAALDLSKNTELNDYHLTCEGNRAQLGTKDGTIPFIDLPGFNVKKAVSIKFTADDGSKATVKKGKTQFTVKKSGVITYTYKADSKRGLSRTFSIKVDFLKPEITSVTLRKKSYAYTGSPIEPTMVVKAKVDGKAVKLTKDDYTVTYENNVEAGTAKVIVEGQGSYQGTITKTFTITPVKILKVALSNYELPYNGKARKPVPTVTAKVGGQLVTLEKDRDYTVKYENNKQPGTATVTVTGKGNYTGTITMTFTIVAPEE